MLLPSNVKKTHTPLCLLLSFCTTEIPCEHNNCDWIRENPASTHNYKYLEIPNSII